MNSITKTSDNNQIKNYFEQILLLSKSGNEFPVNLDDVWPLVYSRKSDAVEVLTKDFLQDVDYQVLRQNPQNPNGGRPVTKYYLTTSCLEFFIARKVRTVFEVYRQVFHKVVKLASYQIEDPIKRAEAWIEEQKQRMALEKENEELKPDAEYTREVLTSTTTWSTTVIAKELGMSAITLNKFLWEHDVQYKQRGMWVLRANYQDKGYTSTKTSIFLRSDGSTGTSISTVWTEAGRKFIHDMVKQCSES